MTSRYLTIFAILIFLCTSSVAGFGCSNNINKSETVTTIVSTVLDGIVSNGTVCTPSNNNSCNDNTTVVYNMSTGNLIYPSRNQVIEFLNKDNTDTLNLPDNASVTQLAANAVTYGFHTQILVIQFWNGQLFSVNCFRLNDGSFMYVDCSKLTGVENMQNTTSLDRILNIENDKPITAMGLTNNSISFTYPNSQVYCETPFWKV
jgi:hypothetical protein